MGMQPLPCFANNTRRGGGGTTAESGGVAVARWCVAFIKVNNDCHGLITEKFGTVVCCFFKALK